MPQPRGALHHLKPVAVQGAASPPQQSVMLAVKSVGVNFRDVLNILGMYPGNIGGPGRKPLCLVCVLSHTHNTKMR